MEYKPSYEITTVVQLVNSLISLIHQFKEAEKKLANANPVNLLEILLPKIKKQLQGCQRTDPELGLVVQYTMDGIIPDDEKKAKAVCRTAPDYEMDNSILCYKGYAPAGKGHREDRLLTSSSFSWQSHRGNDRTYEWMKQK
jgi:hypothetical protein